MGDIEKFVHSIPKIELHRPLFGSVRGATRADLARRSGAAAAAPGAGDTARGLVDPRLVRRPDDLHRLVFEYLQDAAAHRVRHAEFFWDPIATARDARLPYPVALAALVRAIRDAGREFGISAGAIPAIDRRATPGEALEMVDWVATYRADEVVGIGLDLDGSGPPAQRHAEACARARRAGLRTTVQVGAGGWTLVRAAVESLRAERIGRGYGIVDAPDFAARCAERGIVFTVVPGRDVAPTIRRMPALGLRVHPNAGDALRPQATPSAAWLAMARELGFGVDDLRGFMLNGIDGAWVDDATRARWRRDWAGEFDALRRAA